MDSCQDSYAKIDKDVLIKVCENERKANENRRHIRVSKHFERQQKCFNEESVAPWWRFWNKKSKTWSMEETKAEVIHRTYYSLDYSYPMTYEYLVSKEMDELGVIIRVLNLAKASTERHVYVSSKDWQAIASGMSIRDKETMENKS